MLESQIANNIASLNQPEKVDNEDRYEGSISTASTSYFSSLELAEIMDGISDASSISCKTHISTTSKSGPEKNAKPKSGQPKSNDSSNYIENSGSMNEEEFLEWLENQLWDYIQDLLAQEDSLMTDEDGDGYYEIDEEILERYYRKIASFSAAALIHALIFDTKEQCKDAIREVYNPKAEDDQTGSENDENKPLTYMESVAKSNEMMLGIMNQFTTQLIQKVQTENMKVFNDRQADAEAEATEWHDYIPFCGDTEDYLETLSKESEKFKQAMENTMNALKRIMSMLAVVFGNMDSSMTQALDNILADLDSIVPQVDAGSVSGGLPYWIDVVAMFICPVEWIVLRLCGVGEPEYDGAYVDVNALKEEFADVRENLSGAMNAMRFMFMLMQTMQDAKGIIREGFTMLKGVECRADVLATVMETEISHQMMLFDRLTETAIATVKIHNQTVNINFQLQKSQMPTARLLSVASGVLTVVGFVLAIIGLIFSWTGVGFVIACVGIAIAAALTSYGATKYMDGCIDDAYNPSENDWNDTEEELQADQNRRDAIDQLESAQNNILGALTNDNLISTGKDGYQSVEFGLAADAMRDLVGIQNLVRSLMEVRMQIQSLMESIRTTYTGISGTGRSQQLNSALETNLATVRSEFSRLVSNVKECADAFNMEHAQDVAVHNAGITLAWSLGLAVVGGCLGGIAGPIGITVGVALGQALGRFIGEIGSQYGWWGKGGSYGLTFTGKTGDLGKGKVKNGKTGNSIADHIEQMENDIFLDALENGDCDAGDGYDAVDNNLFAQLQTKLLMLANVRSAVAAMGKLTSQLKSMIKAAYGNVTAEESDILTSAMRADIEGSLKVLSYIRSLKQEQVIVQNRARDAEIAVQTAWAKAAITAALSALCAGGQQVASLIPSLISLSDLTVDIVSGAVHSRPDYGELEDQLNWYDDKKNVEAKNQDKKLSDRSAEQRALDEIDSQLAAMGFNSGALESLGGGNMMANSGMLSEAQLKATSLIRVAEMIKEAMKAIAKMKADIIAAETGIQEPDSQLFDQVVDAYRVMMAEIINSKFQTLQAYAQRTNQMADAERGMWQAVASAIIQAAIMAISAAASSKGEEQGELTEVSKEQGLSTEQNQRLGELNDSMKNLAIANFVGQAIAPFVESIAGAIYDQAAHGRDTTESERQIETKQQALTDGASLQGLETLDNMEAESVASSYELGLTEMDLEAAKIQARLNEEIANNTIAAVKSTPQNTKSLVDALKMNNAANQLIEYNELREKVLNGQIDVMDQMNDAEIQAAMTQYLAAQKALSEIIAQFQANPTEENRANLQTAYADYISSLDALETQITETMDSLTVLSEEVDNLEAERAQILNEETFNDTADLGMEELATNAEIELQVIDLKNKLNQLREIRTQIESGLATPEEMAEMLEEVQELQQEINNLAGTAETEGAIFTSFSNSQVMVEASAAALSTEVVQQLTDQMNGIVSEHEQTAGKPLDEMTAEELHRLYQDLHESQFEAAAQLRNSSIALKHTINKILSGRPLTAEDSARAAEALAALRESGKLSPEELQILNEIERCLQSADSLTANDRMILNGGLAALGAIEGKAQQQIKSFNQLIGKIRNILKDKHGMSDDQVTDFLSVESTSSTSQSILSPGASQTAEMPETPVAPPPPMVETQAPVTAPNTPAEPTRPTATLLAYADRIANGTPVMDNGIIVGTNETPAELIADFETVLNDPNMQITETEKSNMEQAVAKLKAIQTQPTADTASVTATSGAGAASEVAMIEEANNNDDEDEPLITNEELIAFAKGLEGACWSEMDRCDALRSHLLLDEAELDPRQVVGANA